MTRVKICGLTNLEDALFAAGAGAEYLGFVFYPESKRFVGMDEVKQICREIRKIDDPPILVGVFVNEPLSKMAEIMESCGLDLAQLNGDEPPYYLGDSDSPLSGRGYKALKPRSLNEGLVEAEWFVPPFRKQNSPSLLIDTYHSELPGGTGKTADWNIAGKIAAKVPELMLAGGLTPMNVREAISKVQPYAVDVASGVEMSPGRKDHKLVSDFINSAHEGPGKPGKDIF